MYHSSKFAFMIAILFLTLPGCIGDLAEITDETSLEPKLDSRMVPSVAGELNDTELVMRVNDVENSIVRSVHFVSPADQKCETVFHTVGNLTEPRFVGWITAMTPTRTIFSHDFIIEGMVNAELAGTIKLEEGEDFPSEWGTTSSSSITLGSGEEIIFIIGANYPEPEPGKNAGRMEFAIDCPEGMNGLETGWSRSAYLLSDITMDGNRASVSASNLVRWSVQGKTEWSGLLPQEPTIFVATEPVAGLVSLTSPSTQYNCGPSADPQTVQGRGICIHEFDGGETNIEVTQTTSGTFGPSPAQSWVAIIASMEYFAWPIDN